MNRIMELENSAEDAIADQLSQYAERSQDIEDNQSSDDSEDDDIEYSRANQDYPAFRFIPPTRLAETYIQALQEFNRAMQSKQEVTSLFEERYNKDNCRNKICLSCWAIIPKTSTKTHRNKPCYVISRFYVRKVSDWTELLEFNNMTRIHNGEHFYPQLNYSGRVLPIFPKDDFLEPPQRQQNFQIPAQISPRIQNIIEEQKEAPQNLGQEREGVNVQAMNVQLVGNYIPERVADHSRRASMEPNAQLPPNADNMLDMVLFQGDVPEGQIIQGVENRAQNMDNLEFERLMTQIMADHNTAIGESLNNLQRNIQNIGEKEAEFQDKILGLVRNRLNPNAPH